MSWWHLSNHTHLIQKNLTELELHSLQHPQKKGHQASHIKVPRYTLSSEKLDEYLTINFREYKNT